ncbi:hypothetical protein [Corynebacterium guaraldiae]|uniref:hypothetical protein n=1 Tax=Corynebacterium guaraldiae TaxID=3051103 RepID=UPI0011853B4C|nr:hypothetical protein [Corynebacterium guaraldiae]TRX54731.1 hypothetical protein FNY91_02155 [Corynebacterium guaraldiae]
MSIALPEGTDVTDSAVGARVTLNNTSEGFFISVELEVTIHGLIKRTHRRLPTPPTRPAPYSKATRCNIDASVTVAED